jgi:hypothetical protein
MNADDPFSPLLPLLTDEIPRLVGAAAKRDRLCRVILWYYDTSAPCCYFLADAMRDTFRTREFAGGKHGTRYLTWYDHEPYKTWIQPMIGRDAASPSFPLFAKIYALLCTDGCMDEPLARFRTFAQRVAFELNMVDWSRHCPVTDDFVVYPQNGTDYGCGTAEDIALSIPLAKRELLTARGLY